MVNIINATRRYETDAYWRVQYLFFAFPDKVLSLSDIANLLDIHKTTANKCIKLLAEQKFLNIEVIGRVWRISCNNRHSFLITRKVPYHLQLIYETGIVEAIKQKVPSAKSITLFGSYRKGDDVAQSDIDIAVEVVDQTQEAIKQIGVVKKLGMRKDVPINIHIFTRKKISLNLFNNIANGIVLDGFLEVQP